jgi:hypothetical protein
MEHVCVSEMLPEVQAIECSLADAEVPDNLEEAEVPDNLEEEVRVALRDLRRKTDQWRPFEDLYALMLRVSDRLDHGSSEQKVVYNCLIAIEKNTKETIDAVKVIAIFIAVVAGFWSAVAWWASYDEIRTFFNAGANLISHQLLGFLGAIH